jgi:hypothetical protein|tara:strand:- start:1856 stop:2806 length:951 start_codon:yes stop_codon:yes gene_type:complete
MTDRYTALEWAAIEGGHDVSPSEPKFAFFTDLHEARMTRDENNQRQLTYTDVCEKLYLSLCILDLVYKYPMNKRDAVQYANKTSGYPNYTVFRGSATDLHNLIYFATGDSAAMAKLKDPDKAAALRKSRTVPLMKLNRYLSAMAYGREMSSSDKAFLLNMESELGVDNTEYKRTRRDIMNWDKLPGVERRKAATRLLLASRAKMRNSDLHPILERLVADKNLETMYGVQDNEPKISSPDKANSNEVIMYKYLYGEQTINFPLIKQFLDRAERGETIPAHLVKAYAPAIKMLDEIVKAGPQYTNMVKIAYNRAKNKP